MSGYSLSKHLFVPFRRPLSQIYRTLNKMTEEGLLEAEKVVQDKLPNQNVYCLTEAGRAELMRWLKQQEPVTVGQMEVLSKLWLGGKVEKEDMRRHLESFGKHVQDQLDYFKGKAKPWVEARARDREYTIDIVYQMLTVDYTIGQYEVALKWAENALKEIENFSPEDGKEDGKTGAAETGKRRSRQKVGSI
ncbi:MAG: PadR family transcriptional regulator [Chloroflexi bacterium]|nr:PadR family transcriptional regulator [Chloroflexota bacterium]